MGRRTRRGLVALAVPAVALSALAGALLSGAGAGGATLDSGAGLATNYDFARLVLHDGGWPVSVNNVTTLVQWLRAEEPVSHWWDRDNPLNDGFGSGGGSGLGSYRSVVTAAYDVARNLENKAYGYPLVASDLAASALPSATARAIWRSSWAAGHYGFGADWGTSPVPVVAAPPLAWQSPTDCPIRYPAGEVGPCGAGFSTTGTTWRSAAPGGVEGQELWAFSTPAGSPDTATWQAALGAGSYDVAAYVPAGFADATASYEVTSASGTQRVVLDQEPYANAWVPLGTFEAGAQGLRVTLGTAAPGPASATFVAADALRFLPAPQGAATGARAGGAPKVGFSPRRPGPPQDVAAVAGDGRAAVSWLAPSKDGGLSVAHYVVVSSPGDRQCRALASATGELGCEVQGLTNGLDYAFEVEAVNRLGEGPRSGASNPVRPLGPASVALVVPTKLRFAERVVLRARLSPATASGVLLFSVGGRTVAGCATATVVHGHAACALRLTMTGRPRLVVTYSGGTSTQGAQRDATLVVERSTTQLHVTASPVAVVEGAALVLHAFDLPGRATGRVVFAAGAQRLCVATLRDGGGVCTTHVALTAGVHLVRATYAGDRNYQAAAGRTTVRVLAQG